MVFPPGASGGKVKVYILYCKDDTLQEDYRTSADEFCMDIRELAEVLVCCGGIECSLDMYAEEQMNYNLWVEQQIRESTHVLMICSPQLMRHLSYGGKKDVRMHKGFFFSTTVVNCIEAPKFVPVFLNRIEPRELMSWVPAQLRTSRKYCLRELREFHRLVDPEEYVREEERMARLAQHLQEPRFRELADLVLRLRGEPEARPPPAPYRPIEVPPHPDPSNLLPRRGERGEGFRRGLAFWGCRAK